ncbi:MAG: ABC transporter permease [Bacteroidota bacterium]
MNKLWLIIKREYLVRVRKKTFILATLLTPLAILLIYALPIILTQFGNDTKRIVVKDDSGIFTNPIADSDKAKFIFSTKSLDELRKSYEADNFDGVLYIPEFKNLDNELYIQYYANQQIGLTDKSFIENRIERRIRDYKMEQAGLTQKQLDKLKASVNLRQKKQSVNDQGEIEEDNRMANAGLATGISLVMGFFLYFAFIVYGQMVMRSVMEEKINRIVEVIISSVKPFQLMLGKIIGVGGVGLTQLLIWFVAIFGIQSLLVPLYLASGQTPDTSAVNTAEAEEAMGQAMQIMQAFGEQNWSLILPLLIIFFLGGYFIYASLHAAVGSAIGDDLGEAGTLTLPIMLPIILAFIITTTMFDNPHGPLAVFASIFPLFSPIVMPARLAFDPPMWEIVLSVVLLIASAFFFVWLSARIYRVGIFMYGKKVTLKEIAKWMFYKG